MLISCTCQFAEDFKKSTSYITQDDRLQLLLTVIENMRIAADLKLGGSVSRIEKNKRVSNTICVQSLWVGAKALKCWNIDAGRRDSMKWKPFVVPTELNENLIKGLKCIKQDSLERRKKRCCNFFFLFKRKLMKMNKLKIHHFPTNFSTFFPAPK